MKTEVATSDRLDSRATPQTPWPLVQPPPRRVPNPTSSPAEISRTGEDAIVHGGTPEACVADRSSGAATMPARKARRQARSPRPACARPPRMPLIPATRPFMNQSSAAESPMSTPPIAAEIGVKFSILIPPVP